MDLVKEKGDLAKHIFLFSLIDELESYVKSLPNHSALKNDLELIKTLGKKVIEKFEKVKNKNEYSQIDKSNIVVEVLKRVFDLSPSDIEVIKSVYSLLSNSKLIKPMGKFKKRLLRLGKKLKSLV